MFNQRILSAKWLVVMLLLGSLSTLLSSQRTVFRQWPSSTVPVEITVESPLDQSFSPNEVIPLAIEISNEGLTQVNYSLEIVQNTGYNSRGAYIHELTLRVPPKSKIKHQVHGLVLLDRGYSISIRVMGSYLEGKVGQVNLPMTNSRNSGLKAVIGMEQSLLDEVPTVWKEPFNTDHSRSSRKYLLQGVDFSLAPANPLWLNHLDRLVLSVKTWNAISNEQRQGVQAWMLKGGHLVLVGEEGQIKDVSFQPGVARVPYGFGMIQLQIDGINDKLSSELRSPATPNISELDRANLMELAVSQGSVYAKERGTNWWIFLGLLPMYAIAAGPAMLVRFAPREKRSRIFWMVPALALGASLVATILIMLGDGFGGKGKRFALIFHDSETQKAILTQSQASISGLLLNKSFETPSDVVLSTSEKSSKLHSSEAGNRLNFSGGYFQNRSVDAMSLTHYYSKRGTYQLAGDDTLVSSSADHVRRGFVFKGNAIWKIENLRPGEKGKLQPTHVGSLKELPKDRNSQVWSGLTRLAAQQPEKVFFIAELERTDDLVSTLESIRWESDSTLYFTQWNQ